MVSDGSGGCGPEESHRPAPRAVIGSQSVVRKTNEVFSQLKHRRPQADQMRASETSVPSAYKRRSESGMRSQGGPIFPVAVLMPECGT
jgi:hypothetical protein